MTDNDTVTLTSSPLKDRVTWPAFPVLLATERPVRLRFRARERYVGNVG